MRGARLANVLGMVAAEAAYTQGEQSLEELLSLGMDAETLDKFMLTRGREDGVTAGAMPRSTSASAGL